MGKGSQKIQVVQYFMSLWYGFASGPVDKITKIKVDGKVVWSGSVSESSTIAVQNSDLFGGITKEGGVAGAITYLDGKSTQTIPQYLASKLGLTTATCPAHRGIASVFLSGGVNFADTKTYGTGKVSVVTPLSSGLNAGFAGANLSTDKGFYWRANQPNVPPISITASRSPKVLSSSNRMIGNDANVVHCIYEVMTNTDWGLGVPSSAINVTSFLDAATTVFSEGIGISLVWSEQESGEDFIAMLLSYIEGVIYINPTTGLFEIELIRAFAEDEEMFEINPSNAKLTGFQRKMWGETINEIVVTWRNPKSEEDETVTVQDLGNIAMQGGIISDSKDFRGVRSSALAKKLATRDLRVASSPLASCRAIVDRTAWKLTPGKGVRVTWPEHGMENIVMRIGDVDYGKSTDSRITISLIEDIFSLDSGTYSDPPQSEWVESGKEPSPIDFSQVNTLPYYLMGKMGVDASSMAEDEVCSVVLASDNSEDTSQFLIVYEDGSPGGSVSWVGTEMRSPITSATLTNDLPFGTSSSTVVIQNLTAGYGVTVDCIALIGTADETQELCVVTAVGTDSVTLLRGVLDTTPKKWSAGTRIWFIPLDADIIDDVTRIAEQSVTYRLLSMTSLGTLAVADAPDLDGVLGYRPWLTLRPANCKVNGVSGLEVKALGASALSLTWSNRNRLLEDSVILSWDSGTVVPEVGQTTTITVISPDGLTVLSTIDGLTGASYTLNTTAFGAFSSGFVKFTSKNADGNESLQGHTTFVILNDGYGYNYGYNYGGAI